MHRPGIIGGRPHHGGGGYVAKAVHFDGSADLHIASLTAPGDDTGFFSFSMWPKLEFPVANGTGLWVSDPVNVYGNSLNPTETGAPGYGLDFANDDFTGVLGTNGSTPFVVSNSVWHNVSGSVQTNHNVGSKIFQFYIDDVAYPGSLVDTSTGFLMTYNGKPFYLCADTFSFLTGDVADIWIAPGQYIDFSVQANRRKFIDAGGKPVFLGANGELPTGTSPAMFFSGAASTFGTNLGTGGTFTTTGTLTNASTSPSG